MALFKPMNLAPTMPQPVSINDSSIINFLRPNGYLPLDKALHNSDVYSAVYQLSADLTTAHIIANRPQNQALIDNPSSTSNRHGFWQAMFAQLLLDGNSYAYIWRNQNGIPQRFEYLRPSQVQVDELADGGGLLYSLTFDEPEIGLMSNVSQSDMVHLRLMSKNGGMTGISPLSALQEELNIKNSANDLTRKALGKAIVPNGILKITKGGLLGRDDKVSLSNDFAAQVDQSNGPAVLDDLTEYTPLEVSTDVTRLLAQTDWTSKQIAKVYGIPDSYLNGQGDQQSSLTMIQGMYANALRRYAGSVEAELNQKLIAKVTVDINPAIDSNGTSFAGVIGTLANNKAITGEQATYMLKNIGFMPEGAPEYVDPTANTTKGGNDNDSEDTNQG